MDSKSTFNFSAFGTKVAPEQSEIMAVAAAQEAAGNSHVFRGIGVIQAWATPTPRNPLVASVTMRVDTVLPTNIPMLGEDGNIMISADGHKLYSVEAGNRICCSSYTIAAACREGNAASHAMACSVNPVKFVPDLLEGAQIDLLVTFVPKGTLYKNPFAKNDKGFSSPSDRVIYNVLAVHLSDEVVAADKTAKLAAIAASRNLSFGAAPATAAPAPAITSGDPF